MNLDDIVKWLLNILELMATLTGFYYIGRWAHTHWRWFPWFLLFIVVTELLGKYMYYHENMRKYNYIVYRYANLPATVFFYLWLMANAFTGKNMRRLAWVAAVLYAILWLVEEFWLPVAARKGISRSYVLGFLFILGFIIAWFYRLIRNPRVVQYKRNMQFWVNSGLLFYIVTLPFSALRKELYSQYPDLFMIYWYTSFAFTYVMYLFFILSFKWAEPKLSYSL